VNGGARRPVLCSWRAKRGLPGAGRRAAPDDERAGATMQATENWDTRDDLAVAFMQALITGRMAAGHAEPSSEAKIWAGKAYALADGFLEARADALVSKE
jgi:hypothetical protein